MTAGTAWAVFIFGASSTALAAANNTAGIEISPVYQSVSIGVTQATANYSVTLTNDTPVEQSFALSTVDFGSLNETGGVAFIGTSTSSYAQKYGLAKWMKLDEASVTLAPGSSSDITVTIENAPTLSYGGHYGAILATAQTVPGGSPVKARVGVLEVLSSLLLLTKAGGPLPNLRVISQTTPGHFLSMPDEVNTTFQDQGDVHVVPRGVINVTDPNGTLVARGAMNVNSGTILPETLRKYSTPLMTLVSAWLPGYYRVSMVYRYDGTNTTKTFVTGFWYVSLLDIAALVAALITVLLGWLFWTRWRVPWYRSVRARMKRRSFGRPRL